MILRTARAAKYGQTANARVLLCALRRGVTQEMFNRRLRLRQLGQVAEFHEKWAAVCADTRAQVLHVHALDDVDAASIAARAAPPERVIFTDGSKRQGGIR